MYKLKGRIQLNNYRYKRHAITEFRAAGWTDDNGEFKEEMQKAICDHVMKLLDVFADEGHSGTTAPYAINLFKKLAAFEPLVPLTGEDWEWVHVADGSDENPLWQNIRCSHVFKDNSGAYDINGKVFWEYFTNENNEEEKSYFTNRKSRVPVIFPYTPTTVYEFYNDEESKP